MQPPCAPKPLDERPAAHGHRLPAAPGRGFRPTGDTSTGAGCAIATLRWGSATRRVTGTIDMIASECINFGKIDTF